MTNIGHILGGEHRWPAPPCLYYWHPSMRDQKRLDRQRIGSIGWVALHDVTDVHGLVGGYCSMCCVTQTTAIHTHLDVVGAMCVCYTKRLVACSNP